ncbi:hypothetical protein [Breoghania sp.]|uniref:hypothetical protein n=1 Tax=Breoghania sp. TaxID=2065378 RepID=UPI002636DC07|nr:hypothetical protein [Breoghania sp.]MDJ0931170.1 hypothetical protein [Breoghania sp.]
MKTAFSNDPETGPKLPREIVCPDRDAPMLDWWKGIYDRVFIAFHPCFRIASEADGDGTGREFCHGEGWFDEDFDDVAKARGVPVSWEEMRVAVAPESCMHSFFMAGWLLGACGTARPGERSEIVRDLQKEISAYCEAEELYFPTGDNMCSVLEPDIFRFFPLRKNYGRYL